MSGEWIRVTKKHPCPICKSDHWCGVTSDGTAAHCMRVESAKSISNGGWIHRLGESVPMLRRRPKAMPAAPSPNIDWAAMTDRYRRQAEIPKLAAELGVSVESLMRLEAGWDGRCWTFPMRDAGDKIIGIRLRGSEGKLCVKGSKTGIFWPLEVYRNSPQLLFITEGPTDCAAMLSMGFDAIGRPSCLGGAGIITEWLSRNHREVVVMADNDPPKYRPDGTEWRPGWDGAVRLVEQIKRVCRSVRIIKPPRHKDIREWYRNGCTAEAVMALVKNQRRTVA